MKEYTRFIDKINHPEHYTQGNRETIDIIHDILGQDGFNAYCVGNVIKYLSRYKYKGGVEDIKKAGKYIEFMVERWENAK